MSRQADELPSQVVAALQRGKKIEAIKLLRKATGVSLREAMERIESPGKPPSADRRPSPDDSTRIANELGAAVRKGDWSHAIELFEKLSGRNLRHFSQAVERYANKYKALSGNFMNSGLSPGEVPRTPLWQIWLVVIVLSVIAYYLLLR